MVPTPSSQWLLKTRTKIKRATILLLFLVGVWLGGTHQQLNVVFTNDGKYAATTIKINQNKTWSTSASNNGNEPRSNTNAPANLTTRDRLVISLKTMPGRIKYIQPTLDSLLFNQTYEFDRLYLVIPNQSKGKESYIIPHFIHNYSQSGLITILEPTHDFGAIDKMLHTLPVEERLFQQQSLLQAHQFRILYLDDDMIYDPRFVEILATKSDQHPNDVVALSGGRLRSHFRQIAHSNPQNNRHPFLYYWLGGLDSHGDQPVDIVQGFMGVLIRLSFFNVSDFVRLAGNRSFPEGVRRLDDFVICGYLESRNITRRCVDGGLIPVTNPTPSHIGNLGKTMHRNAMTAASYLQREWGLWSQYKFEYYEELSERTRNLIDCEARHAEYCPPDVKMQGTKVNFTKVSELLDSEFGIAQ